MLEKENHSSHLEEKNLPIGRILGTIMMMSLDPEETEGIILMTSTQHFLQPEAKGC